MYRSRRRTKIEWLGNMREDLIRMNINWKRVVRNGEGCKKNEFNDHLLQTSKEINRLTCM